MLPSLPARRATTVMGSAGIAMLCRAAAKWSFVPRRRAVNAKGLAVSVCMLLYVGGGVREVKKSARRAAEVEGVGGCWRVVSQGGGTPRRVGEGALLSLRLQEHCNGQL